MTYRPILRFKRGEQTALTNLSSGHKAATKPLLNIASHAFNPPPGSEVDGLFDQRLQQDADRLNSIWPGFYAAVDLGDIDPDARCAGGLHPVQQLFDRLFAAPVHALGRPVLRLGSDDDYVSAVAAVCSDHNVAPVFRMTPDDLAEPGVSAAISDMLAECGVRAQDVDFVVDLGFINTTGRAILTARGALAAVPFAADWDELALVAGSFPENLSGFTVGVHVLDRHEWGVWLANRTVAGRDVIYGDYATIHPIPVEDGLDPRTINPTASVRYTFQDTWILLRGQGTRTRGSNGFAQFLGHAGTLVGMPQYRGVPFSFGDGKIMRIHNRQDSHGNLETWITIGVNHHIAEIVGQLAILP